MLYDMGVENGTLNCGGEIAQVRGYDNCGNALM